MSLLIIPAPIKDDFPVIIKEINSPMKDTEMQSLFGMLYDEMEKNTVDPKDDDKIERKIN